MWAYENQDLKNSPLIINGYTRIWFFSYPVLSVSYRYYQRATKKKKFIFLNDKVMFSLFSWNWWNFQVTTTNFSSVMKLVIALSVSNYALTVTWSWLLFCGLQFASHHPSTWFRKWNVSTTISIPAMRLDVLVMLLRTGFCENFFWQASS